ncbi:MAG: hypothetical protein FWD53_06460 [Phycisphaerales bacterium]|nr:hypothetical protein [Phycisphaerales bacterium]
MMTPRERFLATLLFQKPDRVPFDPGYGRKSTRERWMREGLPPDTNPGHHAMKLLGIELQQVNHFPPLPSINVDFKMIPQFEEKVLEHRPAPAGSKGPGSLVVQDWKGNICEISDEFDVTYLRMAIDFVTRSWIKCPVESREDWEQMKTRYVVNDPARWPTDYKQRAAQLKDRTSVAGITINGPFWQLREWLGFEGLCMLFLDDPEFVKEMIAFWQNFVSQLLDQMFKDYVPDYIVINEDMAYKEKPMIGPEMTRQFLVPCWRQWAGQCKDAGMPIYDVDSDGHVGELIEPWIEAGFNCNDPQEVAAGNDIVAYRRIYGTKMAYRGGVDKRAMAKGGNVIKREIERLQPVIDAGGFIPSCDHGIPSDVSWANYVEYCRLLAKATGWL